VIIVAEAVRVVSRLVAGLAEQLTISLFTREARVHLVA